jgi:hypothetical protein
MKKQVHIFAFLVILICSVVISTITYASPYGKGIYGANVGYGSETALSIATDGNVSIPITPTTAGVLATGTSTVTVTSTDVEGYKLYIRALSSTNMNNLGALLPTSANGSPAALAVNTWGYNLDASNNFVGISLTDTLIRSITLAAPTGDVTTVTYGVKIDLAKPAGVYTETIVYTAVPQTS